MKRVTMVVVIVGLVLLLHVPLTWGGPPNPTQSDVNQNTAGGTGALAVTGGFVSTAFGQSALGNNTTGPANTATGAYALFKNTTGGNNTATGRGALEENTIGNNNTATGGIALEENTTGSNNTATGSIALQSNTTGSNNTATGGGALAGNTNGNLNTANGVEALFKNTGGDANTATGAGALRFNTTGTLNTATGYSALNLNTTGIQNAASGAFALSNNATGINNTAVGYDALLQSTGNQNIAIGQGAGSALTSGNKNIYLGHGGAATESKTMRLGKAQTRTFIAGVKSAAVTGSVVLIDASGQLGTQLSSARYKRDIETIGARSEGMLKLRPVTFVYAKDGQGVRQYGLIAEEVATVYPELVTRTAMGEVQAVRYQELIPMLVNELQRQHQATEHLQRELAELRSLVGEMRGGVAQR